MVDFYLGIGILMILAAVGVFLINKFGQSVILAYIIVGILIGPNLAQAIGGSFYAGLITDTVFIEELLELGLIFLFFFVGLEFSITRLKQTKKVALVLGILHCAANLFMGFMIATIFGWDLFSSIFLAGVIAVSSVATATKSLRDFGRLHGKEIKYYLTGIIVEDFILILMLALGAGAAMEGGDLGIWEITRLIASICFLFSIFLMLGFIIVPRLYSHLEKIQSDELFILIAVGVIFLSATLADMLHIPGPLGAFFVGMTFAETRFSERLMKKLSSLRIGFTAIFFMSFGMVISFEASVIYVVVPMLILAIPLILFNHIFIHGSVSFLMGFTPKEALTIGISLSDRGEDTLLYASIGNNLKRSSMENISSVDAHVFSAPLRQTLITFSGIFCLIMVTITPVLIKNIVPLMKGLRKIVPKKWSFGGRVVQKTLQPIMFSYGGSLDSKDKRLIALFGALITMILGVIIIREVIVFTIFIISGIVIIYFLRGAISEFLSPTMVIESFNDLHLLFKDIEAIHIFVVNTVLKLVSATFIVIAIWSGAQVIATYTGVYVWWVAPAVALLIIASIASGCERIYNTTMTRPSTIKKERLIRGHSSSWDKADLKMRKEKWP